MSTFVTIIIKYVSWTKTSTASKWYLQKKRERTNGWLSNWAVHQQQYQNGAPMFANLRWRLI